MAKKDQIYKCNICGNVVECLEGYAGELVCCNQPMVEFESKYIENEGNEKHVPIISIDNDKVLVKVGSIEHPMTQDHYIELIEILKDGKVIASARRYPNQAPQAEFIIKDSNGISARAYCNIHGLWKSK